ncbi:MAG: GNAT family acetyltransferase [Pseudomonadota bacterium]|nr:GNAT family acetyltransferase [Pseudomonadota bacterium]
MEIREIADGDEAHIVPLWKACGLTRPWNDPESDIRLVREAPGGTILVGELQGTVIATAMPGFDGHRGWIYYVAVRPDLQGKGYGRRILAAAEEWLKATGCPKVELIVREDNYRIIDLYKALDYRQEPRALLAKWLKEPPAQSPDMAGPRLLDVTITYLEMREPPARPAAKPPRTPVPMALQRVQSPTVSYYRYIQHTVGDPWLWWERRSFTDDDLRKVIQDEAVELYVLSVGGVPAGFVELDFRDMPDQAEVAYFGLMPEFIGRGLGPYLLNWGIDCAWNRSPAPMRLTVNTCTLDHPSALGAYQKAGFQVVDRVEKQVPDPVGAGFISKSVKILSPGY